MQSNVKPSPPQHINISYVMRNQIKLFIGERSKTTFDSGCKIFDLFLNEPHQFDFITFQNFYTGYLTIKAKEKKMSPIQNDDWKILIKRHKLMESVHGESGATKQFTFHKENMLIKDMPTIYQLRFILQQPSCNWKDFGLDDIKIKLNNPDLALDKVLEEYVQKCQSIKIENIEKIPPIEDLSSRLQNLWYLCNEASKQTKSELEDNPKFDIEGNYELQTLSYSGQ